MKIISRLVIEVAIDRADGEKLMRIKNAAMVVIILLGIVGASKVDAQSDLVDRNAMDCSDNPCIQQGTRLGCRGKIGSEWRSMPACGVNVRGPVPFLGKTATPSYNGGEFHIFESPRLGDCVRVRVFTGRCKSPFGGVSIGPGGGGGGYALDRRNWIRKKIEFDRWLFEIR